MGHTLALLHETERSDRDLYIKVLVENAKGKYAHYLDRKETINNNVLYDYSSFLHYTPMVSDKG